MSAIDILITGLLAANSAGILHIIYRSGRFTQKVDDLIETVKDINRRLTYVERHGCHFPAENEG